MNRAFDHYLTSNGNIVYDILRSGLSDKSKKILEFDRDNKSLVDYAMMMSIKHTDHFVSMYKNNYGDFSYKLSKFEQEALVFDWLVESISIYRLSQVRGDSNLYVKEALASVLGFMLKSGLYHDNGNPLFGLSCIVKNTELLIECVGKELSDLNKTLLRNLASAIGGVFSDNWLGRKKIWMNFLSRNPRAAESMKMFIGSYMLSTCALKYPNISKEITIAQKSMEVHAEYMIELLEDSTVDHNTILYFVDEISAYEDFPINNSITQGVLDTDMSDFLDFHSSYFNGSFDVLKHRDRANYTDETNLGKIRLLGEGFSPENVIDGNMTPVTLANSILEYRKTELRKIIPVEGINPKWEIDCLRAHLIIIFMERRCFQFDQEGSEDHSKLAKNLSQILLKLDEKEVGVSGLVTVSLMIRHYLSDTKQVYSEHHYLMLMWFCDLWTNYLSHSSNDTLVSWDLVIKDSKTRKRLNDYLFYLVGILNDLQRPQLGNVVDNPLDWLETLNGYLTYNPNEEELRDFIMSLPTNSITTYWETYATKMMSSVFGEILT